MTERSLETKVPTIWADEKHCQEEAEPRRNSDVEKVRREKMQVRESRKIAKHCVFSMICGFGGSKGRLAEAAGAEPTGQIRHEKSRAFAARSTF